ncbi:integrase [Lottiidibacillus patelloidae]|uniref:Integrase n=1 Tax=Lottiidibacillus patelloidae TaxID=2670334 RepID=A0A263BT25_9BACI|nr:tyrosine-type recombinase/integrase [Lottiidibacillus patelloidae]OZM56881.1 integrase [Lottiidibacillus patelloidae]
MLQQFLENGLRGKSNTTVKTYEHAILKFEEWLDGAGTNLQEYARTDVQQYLNYLASRDKSAATINKIWNAIKKYSRWAGKEETIEDINIIKVKDFRNEAPKALNRNELNRLLREVDRTGNKRDIAIVTLLSNTGIRLYELVSLNITSIEISNRKGNAKIIGKGNRERDIPLNSEARRTITRYLEERTDSEIALFLSNRGKRISARSVQHLLEKYGFNVHALRHTFITNLIRSGEDISVVQALSGHANADMILRYSAPTLYDKQYALENLYIEQ